MSWEKKKKNNTYTQKKINKKKITDSKPLWKRFACVVLSYHSFANLANRMVLSNF